MCSFAESDHAKIGNVPKIIFNIDTAQDVPGAAHAARNGSRHVQCIECSQENIPGKLLSVCMGHMGRVKHMEKRVEYSGAFENFWIQHVRWGLSAKHGDRVLRGEHSHSGACFI